MSPFSIPLETYHMALIFLRVGAVIMLLPAVGDQSVPVMVRLAFALMLTLCLGPTVNGVLPPMPVTVGEMGAQVFKELFIGLGMGALIQVMMAALAVCGEIVSIQTTLAFAQTANPSEAQPGATLATFLNVVALALIFATNLDHLFIGAIVHSYTLFPPQKPPMLGDAVMVMIRAVAEAFSLGVQLSAPVIVFSLVFNVAAGLIGRLMPQFQIFFAATPLAVLLGLAVFMLSVGLIGMVWLQRYQTFMAQFT
jgi:flagellar biosynthetic protein FliR